MWDFEKSHNYQKSSVSFDFLLLDVILVIISPSLCQCSLYSCLVTDARERYWGYTPQRLLWVFVKPTSWSATSEYLLGFYLQPCNWVPKDRFQESFFMFHVRKMQRGAIQQGCDSIIFHHISRQISHCLLVLTGFLTIASP